MILILRNNSISVKNPYVPENSKQTKVTYDFELNTNQYIPVLHIENDFYYGQSAIVNFDKYDGDEITLGVELVDDVGRIMRTYSSTLHMYKMCSLGNKNQIDVYDALVKAYERIRQLEEQGEVI